MLGKAVFVLFAAMALAEPPKPVENLDALIQDIFSVPPQDKIEPSTQATYNQNANNNNHIGHHGDVNPPTQNKYGSGNTNVNPPPPPPTPTPVTNYNGNGGNTIQNTNQGSTTNTNYNNGNSNTNYNNGNSNNDQLPIGEPNVSCCFDARLSV